jgi:hypothetical protein
LGPGDINSVQICDHDVDSGFPSDTCASFVVPAATSPQTDPSTPGRRFTFFTDAAGIALTAGSSYWLVYQGAMAYATGAVPNPAAAIVPHLGVAMFFSGSWTSQFLTTVRMLMIIRGCLGTSVSEPDVCRELGSTFDVPEPSMGTLTSEGVKFFVKRASRVLSVSLAFGTTGTPHPS